MRRWSATLALVATVLLMQMAPAVLADERDAAEVRAELEQLRGEIRQISDSLDRTERHRQDTEIELRDIEGELAEAIGQRRQIDRRRQDAEQELKALEAEREALDQSLLDQQERLAQQLRTSYRLGHSGALRLLFAQSQVHDMQQSLAYFSYIHRARAAEIRRFRHDLARLETVEQAIAGQLQRLDGLRAELDQALAAQRRARAERQQVLDRLQRQQQREQRALERLDEDRERLEGLLEELLGVLADIPPEAGEQVPFSQLRGSLPWPLESGSRTRQRQGLFIEAEAGRAFHTVAEGRVVFADWLRGFGLLLIVEHSDGYMSLYGHADAVYRQVGEWVQPGDALGEVGSSGGQRRSGLYFELRRQGRPVPLAGWMGSP